MFAEQNGIQGAEGPRSLDNAQGKKSGDGILGDIIHEAHSAMAWVALKGEVVRKPEPIETEGDKKFLVFAALAHEGHMSDSAAEDSGKKKADVIDPADWLDNKTRLQRQSA